MTLSCCLSVKKVFLALLLKAKFVKGLCPILYSGFHFTKWLWNRTIWLWLLKWKTAWDYYCAAENQYFSVVIILLLYKRFMIHALSYSTLKRNQKSQCFSLTEGIHTIQCWVKSSLSAASPWKWKPLNMPFNSFSVDSWKEANLLQAFLRNKIITSNYWWSSLEAILNITVKIKLPSTSKNLKSWLWA